MKRILIVMIMAASIFSCEKEKIEPCDKPHQEEVIFDDCGCGEVIETKNFTGVRKDLIVKNNCTGNLKTFKQVLETAAYVGDQYCTKQYNSYASNFKW